MEDDLKFARFTYKDLEKILAKLEVLERYGSPQIKAIVPSKDCSCTCPEHTTIADKASCIIRRYANE